MLKLLIPCVHIAIDLGNLRQMSIFFSPYKIAIHFPQSTKFLKSIVFLFLFEQKIDLKRREKKRVLGSLK